MIVSFHPCIKADVNRIVAGRPAGPQEKSLIERADAVILPQGVREDLYRLCRHHCRWVFPNYDIRFQYPGKMGDVLLLRALGTAHPRSFLFSSVAHYHRYFPPEEDGFPFPLPFVLKGNFGGEGRMVFKICNRRELEAVLEELRAMERSGLRGFVTQQWINHGGRDLRVVVLYDKLFSYWRKQKNPGEFRTNLSRDAVIDPYSDPHLRQKAEETVRWFCRKTGANLAGIDLMFDEDDPSFQPLLGEINYWFGRRFFGSSEVYYAELGKAVQRWLAAIDPAWSKRLRCPASTTFLESDVEV
ncbi:MAG: RimK family alpha-L-glutamate ligase [Syntrophobacteria bacterium]